MRGGLAAGNRKKSVNVIQCFQCLGYLLAGARLSQYKRDAEFWRGVPGGLHSLLGRIVARVVHHQYSSNPGRYLFQKLQPFARQLRILKGHPGGIATRTSQIIATFSRSINMPVVARPFQFVLVDRPGVVTFQRSDDSFRGERFFEVVRGGSVLQQSARWSALSEPISVEYRGRSFRMQAQEVPDLDLTLVSYYEQGIVGALGASATVTSAWYMVRIIVAILLGGALARLLFPATAFDWMWPSSHRRPVLRDRHSAVRGQLVRAVDRARDTGCSRVELVHARGSGARHAGAGVRHDHEADPGVRRTGTRRLARRQDELGGLRRAFDGTQGLFGGLRHRVQGIPGLRWLQRLDAELPPPCLSGSTPKSYKAFALLGLIAFVAWPTMVVFDDAYRAHAAAYQSFASEEWQLNSERWLDRNRAALVDVGAQGLSAVSCKDKADVRCRLPEKNYAIRSNHDAIIAKRHDFALYDVCADLIEAGEACATNRAVGVPSSFTVGRARLWARLARQDFDLGDTFHRFDRQQRDARRRLPLLRDGPLENLGATGFVLVLVVLCLLVGSVASHVLGSGLSNDGVLDEHELFAPKMASAGCCCDPGRRRSCAALRPDEVIDLRAELKPELPAPARETDDCY